MIAALVVGLVLAADSASAGSSDPTASTSRDTLVRVPGSVVRLGWDHARTSTLGSFRLESSNSESEIREGEVRWFGYPAKVTLTYRAERLSDVRLASTGASPRFADYVPDELRRLGYRRTGLEGSMRDGTSQWEGEASVRLTVGAGSVVAEVSARAPSAPGHSAKPGPATPAATPPPMAAAASPAAAEAPDPEAPLVDFTTVAPESLEAGSVRPLAAPPAPARPQLAVEAGVFGRVVVRVTVGTTGTVEDARIERGIPELNNAALGWAGSLRFEPLQREGRPVRFALLVPVAFLPVRSGAEEGKP